jgi:hypothetical protein
MNREKNTLEWSLKILLFRKNRTIFFAEMALHQCRKKEGII